MLPNNFEKKGVLSQAALEPGIEVDALIQLESKIINLRDKEFFNRLKKGGLFRIEFEAFFKRLDLLIAINYPYKATE